MTRKPWCSRASPAVPDKTVTVDRVVVDVLFEDDPAGEESEPDAGDGENGDALLTVKRSAQALVELGEGSVTVRQNMAATRFFSAFNVPDGRHPQPGRYVRRPLRRRRGGGRRLHLDRHQGGRRRSALHRAQRAQPAG